MTVIEKALVAVPPPVSVTLTEKLNVAGNVPTTASVPEITPVDELRVSPVGRTPEASVQVDTDVPAPTVASRMTGPYAVAFVPGGRGLAVFITGAGMIVIERIPENVGGPNAPVTVTAKSKGWALATVGMPEINPPRLRVSPFGRAPEASNQR